jgi:hypothetical protein
VGPYTAAAIEAFAHNKPTVFIETNIRTVFIYYCFAKRRKLDSLVSDAEILPLVEKALTQSRMKPRDFYAALMDYGSHLKQRGIKLNTRSKHYNKQSKFEGSYRQLRGAILRALLAQPQTMDTLVEYLHLALKGLPLGYRVDTQLSYVLVQIYFSLHFQYLCLFIVFYQFGVK